MSQKHMSPAEFNKFMKERYFKRLEQNPGKTPICIGTILLPPEVKFWPEKIHLVECCRCGIPIYVTDWVYLEMQKHRVPWDETKIPFFCPFCVPRALVKGTLTQDMAAVLQHTGEK
jgi:hypothetical protein